MRRATDRVYQRNGCLVFEEQETVATTAQHTVASALKRPRNGNARRGRSVWRAACRAALFAARRVWVGAALLVAACHASEPVENKEDNIMVEFNNRPRAADVQQLADDYGLRVIKLLPSSPIAIFKLDAGGDPASVIRRLARDPVVRNAELDQRVSRQGDGDRQI